MTRRLAVVVSVAALVVGLASGCAVPNRRAADGPILKAAATQAQVTDIYANYREVRNAAVELLDPKPLSTVETGAVLAVDTGAFAVSQKLRRAGQEDTGPIDVARVETPRFGKYPLWLFAVVRDSTRKVQRLQIFERTSAVDPWLLVATPEALTSTKIPGIRHDGSGHAMTVKPTSGTGMAMSAQEAADAYARVLTDAGALTNAGVSEDAFIRQMREIAASNAALDGVTFAQTWAAEKVEHVLRTSDGGALAFITLLRKDEYVVPLDRKITWPAGSPQQALLEDGIQGTKGNLNYYHQIVVHIPGGTAKPRTIGQFGGVVQGEIGLDQAVNDESLKPTPTPTRPTPTPTPTKK